MTQQVDVCVSGGGAVAMALALLLSAQGHSVAWTRPEAFHAASSQDVRTYALNARSVALLDRLKVWPALQAHATRVLDMRVQGDGGGALHFSAWQQHVAELAWIVDAGALERLLAEALRFAPRVDVVPPLRHGASPVPAQLLAVCEGKHSEARRTLGVGFDRHAYGHLGVATRLRASRPHQGMARQWFRSPDVLALLPFDHPQAGASYGLVWSLPQARAAVLLQGGPEALALAVNEAVQLADPAAAANVGELTVAAPLASWPLALAQAERWCGPGWALLGDAAHQVHPLAGQGLNLGLADAEVLATVLAQARQREPWRSLGDERVLQRYARQRALPTQAMAGLTDTLLHLFADPRGPVRDLRNLGLGLVNHLGPLKRALIGRALDA